MNDKKKLKKSDINNQQKDSEELKKQLEDYKNKYLRALADYQNLEKRVFEEKNKIINNANANFILKLLPILDNLEKAEVFLKDQGLKIIKDDLIKLLKEEGLEELDLLGKEFDPNFAEAIDVCEGERDNIIIDVLRKGYKFKNKILRVAQVKVSKKINN
ncbi:MAG: nucleotide exchange factor GrpE [Patescibacteria group bacterium]|nr:nucleotide exchange factor GrpE [Patescibacteria group bacterium]